jgi:hypothetical protein
LATKSIQRRGPSDNPNSKKDDAFQFSKITFIISSGEGYQNVEKTTGKNLQQIRHFSLFSAII